ncbi:MAG: hypothetical protein COA71_12770 [SAR86 cluster bacterium]|uniref:Uncharacterized protein n=1 Tax=SAR86 cluster bacterium TaxID=2030880 RepID=A0A2A5C8Q6_9GAMM|nr:hypothetical protein [Gammaproteobacteria bacterium AH-315-E17]PCJ39756.1 MAG: hypothetical protein COA71_12770 [SAR86 cluster bacterium]
MTHFRCRHYLSIVYVLVLLVPGVNTAFAQSDAQIIVNNLESGNQDSAQIYMDRLTRLDANKLQCNLLSNFNYIFDYDSSLFNKENMEWLLDSFRDKGYAWPSTCDYRGQVYDAHCLIYGDALSPNQANLLKEVFEQLSICPVDNLICTEVHNMYENAEYTDIYLYVAERYFSEANLTDKTRNRCGNYQSWAEAIVHTHTEYFNLGWAIYDDFQLESGSTSLQKSLDGMQRFVSLNANELRQEYESLLQNLSNTDSSGARGKYRMFVRTLTPYVEN